MSEILTVKNLSAKNADGYIIKDVSFTVNAGEVLVLSGQNGSGKSTILKAIVGDCDYADLNGYISYMGSDNILAQKDRQWFNRSIGYVGQEDSFATDTAFNEVKYSTKLYSQELATNNYVKELFEEYHIGYLAHKKLNEKWGSQLSGGEKKMISLLCAVARKDAKLFIVDEPLNSLDIKNVKAVSNMITRLHNKHPDIGIVLVTHCRVFPCVTRMLMLDKGIVVPNKEEYVCHNCFGKANEEGYYV